MFLHCLNHWKLETPTARKQQMSSEDVSAYKVCTAAVEVHNADLGPHADPFCKMVLIWFSFAVTGPHLHDKR